MEPDITAVIADARLSPEACRIVLYVASMGDGAHEVSHREFARVLQNPGQKKLREAIQDATDLYLNRTAGGRGHNDRYEFRCATSVQPKSDRVAPGAHLKPTVVGGEGSSTPFDSPVDQYPLAVNAMKAISDSAEKLEGCRGALVDYLQARVKTDRQYSYVQAVVSWLDNPAQVFNDATGARVPQAERVKLLAVALNEMAASDESMYKAPVGDVRNVKNKLFALAKGFGRKATGTDGPKRYGKRDAPADAQTYKPTDTWSGEFKG